MLFACGGAPASEPDAAGPADAPPDVAIDADEGVGVRISVTTLGVRDPLPVTLSSAEGTQQIVVTQDTGTGPVYRFPRRLAGGAFSVTTGGAQACQVDAPAEATANVTVAVVCDGIVDLASVTTSRTLEIVPSFDPRARTLRALQPLLIDPDETTAVTIAPIYPSAATQLELQVAGTPVAAIPQATLGGTDVDLVVTRDGFARTYTLQIERALIRREAYAKASDTAAGMFLGGVGKEFAAEGIEIVPNDGDQTDILETVGNGVAISGDTVVVGAHGRDAAYVFVRDGLAWTVQQKLVGLADSDFGVAVAIAGDTIVVGAPHDGAAGAARVFVRAGTTWTLAQTLRPAQLAANALFGAAVAMTPTKLVVGAPNQNGASGAAYLFAFATTWQLDQELVTTTNGRLGTAVAVSDTDLAIAAPFESGHGAVYAAAGTDWAARTQIAGATGAQFGLALGLDTALVIGAPQEAAGAGRAHVFRRTGATWPTTESATLSTTGTLRFGSAIAVQRGRVAIGAPNENAAGPLTGTGAVYFFHCTPGCTQEQRVVAAAQTKDDRFGKAVAVDRETLVVGAPLEDSSATGVNGNEFDDASANSGAIYISR